MNQATLRDKPFEDNSVDTCLQTTSLNIQELCSLLSTLIIISNIIKGNVDLVISNYEQLGQESDLMY